MKVRILESFSDQLDKQVDYIAQDKPQAATKFRKALIARIRDLKQYPFKYRKSVYANEDAVRDLIFKGYVITYKVDLESNIVSVFAIKKQQEKI